MQACLFRVCSIPSDVRSPIWLGKAEEHFEGRWYGSRRKSLECIVRHKTHAVNTQSLKLSPPSRRSDLVRTKVRYGYGLHCKYKLPRPPPSSSL